MQLFDVFNLKRIVEYFARKKVRLFEMILQKWKTLKELVVVFKIPYNATIALQNPRITLSDVYGIWTKMRLHLEACAEKESFKTKLSQNLIECLKDRYETIFNNPKMECSLFLDPRFRGIILNNQEVLDRTEANLVELHNRLQSLKANTTQQFSNESSDLHLSFDEQEALNKHMTANASQNNIQTHLSIEDAISSFQPDILPSEKSVLDFWETQKSSLLYDLAMAIYSIPPTQVQIERDFSSLGHIFSERRYRLSQHRLEQILLIHFNKEIFYEVKRELINKA